MRAVSSHRPKPLRHQSWPPFMPLALSVVFGSAMVLISANNLSSVKDTAEQARQGRAVGLALQTRQSLVNMGFLTKVEQLRAALRNISQGAIQAVALTDTDGQIIVAHPSGPLGEESRRLVRITHAAGRSKTVVKRRGGSHPTYEIVMVLKPQIPEPVQKYFKQILSKLPPHERPGFKPALGPDKILLRTMVTVHDDASIRAVGRARRTQYVAWGVTGLLLFFSFMAFVGSRRHLRLTRALERQQALAEMGEMAAVLAHEIRNPVGIIKGRAQVLLEEDQPVPPTALRSLVDQSQRLEQLINTLLEFARPSPPRPEELEGEQLVEAATEAVAQLAVDKQIAIVPDVAPGTLRADPDQVHRVLVNLLRNALEATPEHGRINIKLRFQGEQAVLTVSDTGPGLSPELGEDLFKPFVTTRQKGSGLGLAVVRRIVEMHDGEVSADNLPQGGACLEVRLPRFGPVGQAESANREDSND